MTYLLRVGAVSLMMPKAYVQQTGQKLNTTVNASSQCATDTSYDLTYKLYLRGGCSMAEAQTLFQQIRNQLIAGAVIEQQIRPDAELETFSLQSGTILPTDFEDTARSQLAVYRAELSLTVNASGEATFVYPNAAAAFALGTLDWTAGTVHLTPVMEDSTAPSEPGALTTADFTTFDAFDGGTPGPFTLGGREVTPDIGARTAWLSANDVSFASTNGSRKIKGYVATRVSDDLPLVYIAVTPFDPGGVARYVNIAVPL